MYFFFPGGEGKNDRRSLVQHESSGAEQGAERRPAGPEDERLPGHQEVLQEEWQRRLPQVFPGEFPAPTSALNSSLTRSFPHKTFTMISAQSHYCPCAWVWWCVMCVGRLAQWWTIQWTSIIPGFPRRPGREPWWRSCWPTPSSDSKSDTLVLLDFVMSHKAALQWQLHLYCLSLHLNGSTVFSGTSFVYSTVAFWLIQVLTTNTDAKWWQCVICDHLISFWRH